MCRKFLLLTICFVLFGAVALYSQTSAEQQGKVAWKISGELEEACKCAAACPCWFGSKPTHMNCGGGQFLFIEKGHYGNLSLDGLSVGRLGQSPDGQAMMDSFGNWVFDYIYIDEKANEEVRKALKEITLAIMPPASKNLEVRYVPITRKIEGKEHQVSVGQYGNFSGHLLEGGLGGPV